eukprot:806705-Amphidinium_carterae.1
MMWYTDEFPFAQTMSPKRTKTPLSNVISEYVYLGSLGWNDLKIHLTSIHLHKALFPFRGVTISRSTSTHCIDMLKFASAKRHKGYIRPLKRLKGDKKY